MDNDPKQNMFGRQGYVCKMASSRRRLPMDPAKLARALLQVT